MVDTSSVTAPRNGQRLRSESIALVTATVTSSCLGALFWWLATRQFGASTVGESTALLAIANVVALFATAGADIAGLHLLPRASSAAERGKTVCALAVVVGTATALAAVPLWWFVRSSHPGVAIAMVPLLIVGVGANAFGLLFDTVATATDRSVWATYRAVGQSVAKLVLLFVAAIVGLDHWWVVLAVWIGVGAISLVPLGRGWLRSLGGWLTITPPNRESVARVIRSAPHHLWAGLLGQLPMMTVPIIAMHQIGPLASAHAYVGWMLAGIAFTVSSAAGRVALSQASHRRDDASAASVSHTVRMGLRFALGSGSAVAAAIAVGAPIVLRFFGRDFGDAVPMIRWMLLAIAADAYTNLYVAGWRAAGRTTHVSVLNVLSSGTALVGAWVLTPRFGIVAFGWSWLAAQTVGSAYVFVVNRCAQRNPSASASALRTKHVHPKPLLIVGAHKAGTTALYEALAVHPDIIGAEPKEPGFFTLHWSNNKRRLNTYLRSRTATAPGASRPLVWMDGSTTYGQTEKYPGISARLAGCLGRDTKVIFMVRDPLARIASGYTQLRSEWLRNVAGSPHDCMDELVEPTLYRTHITRFTAEFGEDNVLVLSQEALAQTPERVIRRVQEFIGVEPISLDVPRSNTTAGKHLPPPQWHDKRALRLVRYVGQMLPPQVRSAGTATAMRLARHTGEPALCPSLDWPDLGKWADRVADEARWARSLLPVDDPAWPSLTHAPMRGPRLEVETYPRTHEDAMVTRR